MPSIQCTHCGAVLKTPNVIAPGKKVQCPKCAEMFVVEAGAAAPDEGGQQAVTATPTNPAKASPDADEGVAEGTPPPKGKRRFDRDAEDEPDRSVKNAGKKSNMLLFLLLGGGFLFLTCCIGAPVAVFFFILVPTANKVAVEVKKVEAEMKKAVAEQNKIMAEDIAKRAPELEPAKKDGPPNIDEPGVPVSVSADQLTQEIDNDRKNFQAKYAGQEVIVKGVIASVAKLDQISTTVQLQTASKVRLLANFVPPDTITATKGQTIEFSIRFQNFAINGDDLRISAKLISQGKGGGDVVPPKTMIINADLFARSLDKNRAILQTKYAGKEAIVKGVVESTEKFGDGTTVILKTKSKTRINVNFRLPEMPATTVGAAIEFRVVFENFSFQDNDFRIRGYVLPK